MDPQLRERYRDSYGTPLKQTWWMQGGSLYRPALNTNVPHTSSMSTRLMYRHHREAMERFRSENRRDVFRKSKEIASLTHPILGSCVQTNKRTAAAKRSAL